MKRKRLYHDQGSILCHINEHFAKLTKNRYFLILRTSLCSEKWTFRNMMTHVFQSSDNNIVFYKIPVYIFKHDFTSSYRIAMMQYRSSGLSTNECLINSNTNRILQRPKNVSRGLYWQGARASSKIKLKARIVFFRTLYKSFVGLE